MQLIYRRIVQNLSVLMPQRWIEDDIWRQDNFYYGPYAETSSQVGPALVFGAKSGILPLKWALVTPQTQIYVVEQDPALRQALESAASRLAVHNLVVHASLSEGLDKVQRQQRNLGKVWVDWSYFSEELLQTLSSRFNVGYLAGEFNEFQMSPLWLHRLSRQCADCFFWHNLTIMQPMAGQSAGSSDVSVIVTPDDSIRNLARCIESLRAQTLANLEIWLAISKDEPEPQWDIQGIWGADLPIKLIEPLEGRETATLESVLNKVSGVFVSFVDGGDTLAPPMLQMLAESSIRFNSQIAQCGYRLLDPEGSGWREVPERFEFRRLTGQGSGLLVDPKELSNCPPGIGRQIFLREFLADHREALAISEVPRFDDRSFQLQTSRWAERVSVVNGAYYNRVSQPENQV